MFPWHLAHDVMTMPGIQTWHVTDMACTREGIVSDDLHPQHMRCHNIVMLLHWPRVHLAQPWAPWPSNFKQKPTLVSGRGPYLSKLPS